MERTAGPGKKSGGKGTSMTCKPITYPDGTPITDSAPSRLSWVSTGGINANDANNAKNSALMASWVYGTMDFTGYCCDNSSSPSRIIIY